MEPARLAAALLVVALAVAGCDRPPPPAPPPAIAPPAAGAEPETATMAPPARPESGARDVTFDDIKLDLAKGAAFTRDVLPKRVTSLDGTRIRIRGYILPSFQQTGLTQFVLVRDNQECCFGPGAALHDCIVVRMLPGRSADFSIRPVAVAGRFRLDELVGPDGRHLAIYALDGEDVR